VIANKLLRARTDSAKWMEMHTFGRSQGTLNIIWNKRDYLNGEFDPTMGGALLFEGSADDAESITNIAILYLDGSRWREPWIDQDGSHWDSMWASNWGT
jgi:hypothetical protein